MTLPHSNVSNVSTQHIIYSTTFTPHRANATKHVPIKHSATGSHVRTVTRYASLVSTRFIVHVQNVNKTLLTIQWGYASRRVGVGSILTIKKSVNHVIRIVQGV